LGKVLSRNETLPAAWPVDGTTGYDFAAIVQGLWVDGQAEQTMNRLYRTIAGDTRSFSEHVYDSKQYVLTHALVSEINVLAARLQRIAMAHRRFRDFTLFSLATVLREVVSAFPVYRTYIRNTQERREEDVRAIRTAVRLARRRRTSLSPSIFDFVEQQLLGEPLEGETEPPARHEFALPFQQLTAPVMGKAVEDSASYRYSRLICLHEVGGPLTRFGTSVAQFHAFNEERVRGWPQSMSTTSTHDTKRGEDASARIAVLSEVPREWSRAAKRWVDFYRTAAGETSAELTASLPFQYYFFQALVGAWPFGWNGRVGQVEFKRRLVDFALKASREARVQTSWLNPHLAFENSLTQSLERLLDNNLFLDEVRTFCSSIDLLAACNALSQCLLRLTSPGVADTYQGAELWHQALTDPDNRSPVDFRWRARCLADLRNRLIDRHVLIRELLDSFCDGRIKLFVTHLALQARKLHKDLFLRGDYEAIPSDDHLVAFTRGFGSERLICCVPRLICSLTKERLTWPVGAFWGNTELTIRHTGHYRNVFTNAQVTISRKARASGLLADFPVALLINDGPDGG
jgi:(1->4)-alpha-D-glucan 1-alpha-D-glucosylmutase